MYVYVRGVFPVSVSSAVLLFDINLYLLYGSVPRVVPATCIPRILHDILQLYN